MDLYYSAAKGRLGVRGSCKECESKKAQERYQKDPEKHQNAARKWRANNRDLHLHNLKQWHKDNRDHELKYKKKRYKENAEKLKQERRNYYKDNKKEELLRSQEWRNSNKQWFKEYYKKNIEQFKQHNRNRNARIRGAEGSYTAADIMTLYKKQNGLCNGCNISLKDGYHADHIMPVSRGGSNWISNIQLLCPLCNYRKNNKTMEEFEIYLEGAVR